jgi:predicted O-methyltransferase YrrM
MESIVEIGSWHGKSTHALCSGCPGNVYAIDWFKGSPGHPKDRVNRDLPGSYDKEQFVKNTRDLTNLKHLEMRSSEAAKHFEKWSVDMVFIDGDHAYEAVLLDILLWLPKTRVMICGHDINEDEVKNAVNYCFSGAWQNPVGTIWEARICDH